MVQVLGQAAEETNDFKTLADHINGSFDISTSAFFNKSASRPLPMCDWMAINAFYSMPWFSRLWTVQEVALAKEVVLLQGEYILAWKAVCLVARWLGHRRSSLGQHCDILTNGVMRASVALADTAQGPDDISLANHHVIHMTRYTPCLDYSSAHGVEKWLLRS